MSEKKKNDVRSEIRDVPVADIVSAKFNTHLKERKGDEDFDSLVRNIRELGLIQRINLRPLADSGKYEIIDGHRRFAAVKALGWKEIPAEIRAEDDVTANFKMVSANLQRSENDTILESVRIGQMQKAGRTNAEIAATLGKSEAWVVRHARLTALIPEWIEIARHNDFTADCLMRIAAYTEENQRKVFNANHNPEDELDGRVTWDDYEAEFKRCLLSLDEVSFDTAACAACPNNTVCSKHLFPELDDEDAHCQNASCFKEKWNAAVDAMLLRFRKSGLEVIQVAAKYKIPNYWNTSRTKTKKNPQPYLYEDDGLRHLVFGEAKAPSADDTVAKTREEIQAERAAKKAERLRRTHISDVRTRIRAVLTDPKDQQNVIDRLVKKPDFLAWARDEFTRRIAGCYRSDSDCDLMYKLIGRETLAIAMSEDEQRDYEAWISPADADNTDGKED